MSKVIIKVTGKDGASLYVRRTVPSGLRFQVAIRSLAKSYDREKAEELVVRFAAAVKRAGLWAQFDIEPADATASIRGEQKRTMGIH